MPRKAGVPRTERQMILYTEEEFMRLKKLFVRSVSRTLSSYIRKVSLEEPVEVIERNGSFDRFIEEIVELRREMAAIRKTNGISPELANRLILLHESIQSTINQIAELCMPR